MTPKNQTKNAANSPNFDTEHLSNLTSDIIAQAKKLGATASEVNLGANRGLAVSVRNNAVDTLEYSNGANLDITVYFGNRTGSAATADLNPDSIATTLAKACHIARFTSIDPFVGLADKELMATNYPDLDLYHPWSVSADEAIEMLKNCEHVGLAYDKRLTNAEGVSLDTVTSCNVYGNSHDFCGATTATRHSISCSFLAEQNHDMQRDYYYTIARDPLNLETANNVALIAAERSIKRLNAQKLPTCQCPVIFTAEIASSLIGHLVSALYGNNIYRKSSFLCDHLNQPVIASHINIEENPLLPKGLGSAAFDEEGVRLARNPLVTNGILQRYLLDSYAARKLNLKTTGNAGGIHNLIVTTGKLSQKELLQKMGTGLLVTEFLGSGVNILTGDYSRGVFGYWIENGQVKFPISGATIAGNLKDMLLNIIDISNDVDYRSNILTGSILLGNMVIAGN